MWSLLFPEGGQARHDKGFTDFCVMDSPLAEGLGVRARTTVFNMDLV